ncbi:hypothetical protein V8E52_002480 [Russula decolorans]
MAKLSQTFAAHSAPTPEASFVPVQSSKPVPFLSRRPPHQQQQDDLDGELYDLYDVRAPEKAEDENTTQGKPKTPPPSLPASTSSAPAATQPASTACSTPQYRYQSNAEDQQLTTQLFNWLLEAPFLGTSKHRTVPVLLGHMSRPTLREYNVYHSAFQWSFSTPRATTAELGPCTVQHNKMLPRHSPSKNMTKKLNNFALNHTGTNVFGGSPMGTSRQAREEPYAPSSHAIIPEPVHSNL